MSHRATFRRSADRRFTIVVEPWAEEYVVEAGQTIEVVFSSSEPANLEVVDDGERITLFGWAGSTYEARRDGVLLP